MNEAYEPYAYQIIDFDNENKITLDIKFLHRILLQDDIKDKPVCVISVTGAFRQGKSFLLNFLIRYLHVKYKLKTDVSKWLDSTYGPIKGFPWKNGDKPETTGILMWSEIFLAELPTGEEMAIILLDTQGSFDLRSDVNDCVAIFVLSTLISSVQIYNLSKNIDQTDLSHLECFSSYGQFFTNADTPFQNLIFLIRDWPYSYKKSFGASGGQELLEEIFDNQKDQSQVVNLQVKNIQNLFERIACFLMPYPGDTVATTKDFKGNPEDIAPLFLEYIAGFMSINLTPENLVPKIINGERIKVKDVCTYIDKYCQHFRDGGLPSVQSMFMATADAHHNTVFNEAKSLYEESMSFVKSSDSESLEQHTLWQTHEQNKNLALTFFEEKRILGDDEVKKRYKLKLEEIIEEKFLEYRNFNDIKCKNEQQLKHEQDLRREMEEKHLDELEQKDKINRELQESYENKLRKESKLRSELELSHKSLEEKLEEKERDLIFALRSHDEEIQRRELRREQEFREECRKASIRNRLRSFVGEVSTGMIVGSVALPGVGTAVGAAVGGMIGIRNILISAVTVNPNRKNYNTESRTCQICREEFLVREGEGNMLCPTCSPVEKRGILRRIFRRPVVISNPNRENDTTKSRTCQICNEEFLVRLYDGEGYMLCPTCRNSQGTETD